MGLSQHLDKLEAFSVIAETQKMNEAAKLLNLSQPSLTRLVDTLESILDVKLFIRSRSGSKLTPAGEELYSYTKSILNPLQNLEARLKSPLNIDSGHLRIGSYESLAEYLWPDFLKKMRGECPNLRLSIKTSFSNKHISSLEKGGIDLLVDAEPRVTGDLDSFPLFNDYFSFYIQTKIFRKEKMDLDNHPIIFVPSAFDEKNKSLSMLVAGSNLVKNEKIELDSFTTARTFCEQGLGVAILPNRLAKSSVEKNILCPISMPGISKKFGRHAIYMTTLSKRTKDHQIQFLRKKLKTYFK